MRFWPLKFRTIILLVLLGMGGWQTYQYLIGTDKQLVAIDTETGEILWNRPIPEQSRDNDYPLIPLSGDRLLLTDFLKVDDSSSFWKSGKRGHKTVCFWSELDQRSGAVLWRKSLKEMGLDGCPFAYAKAVVQDQQIYTFWEGRLWDVPDAREDDRWQMQQAIVAMDLKDHRVRWISPLQSQKLPMQQQPRLAYVHDSSLLIVRSGKIIAGIGLDAPEEPLRSVLKGLDMTTGSVVWQQKLSDYSRPILEHNGSLIFSNFSDSPSSRNLQILRSHNLETGKLEATSQALDIDDPFQFKGNLYTGTSTTSVQKFAPKSGTHILNSPLLNLPITPRSCIGTTVYPSQNHLLGLCMVNPVSYRDPESYQLFALDDQTGEQKWQLHISSRDRFLDSGFSHRMTIGDTLGKQLFIPTVFQAAKSQEMIDQIQSITTQDGKQKWRLPIDMSEQPVVSGDRLFVIARLPRWQTFPMTRPKPMKS
jgi:outer membrane protein assembly factor BamB